MDNPEVQAVDVGGWQLAGGISFRFPAGTLHRAGGDAVVAADPAALRAKFGVSNPDGPWTGKLSNQGDKIVLQDSALGVVDEVEYRLGFPWPTVGDAPGYSIELINPGLDNSLGGSWRASVLGNAEYFEAPLIAEQSAWKYLPGLGEASDPATAWREPGFEGFGVVERPNAGRLWGGVHRDPLERHAGQGTRRFLPEFLPS